MDLGAKFSAQIPVGTDLGHPRVHSCPALCGLRAHAKFFCPSVITLPSQYVDNIRKYSLIAYVDSFEEFGSTFGLIMMFRRLHQANIKLAFRCAMPGKES